VPSLSFPSSSSHPFSQLTSSFPALTSDATSAYLTSVFPFLRTRRREEKSGPSDEEENQDASEEENQVGSEEENQDVHECEVCGMIIGQPLMCPVCTYCDLCEQCARNHEIQGPAGRFLCPGSSASMGREGLTVCTSCGQESSMGNQCTECRAKAEGTTPAEIVSMMLRVGLGK
jgi:hypothetical protein